MTPHAFEANVQSEIVLVPALGVISKAPTKVWAPRCLPEFANVIPLTLLPFSVSAGRDGDAETMVGLGKAFDIRSTPRVATIDSE